MNFVLTMLVVWVATSLPLGVIVGKCLAVSGRPTHHVVPFAPRGWRFPGAMGARDVLYDRLGPVHNEGTASILKHSA